MSAPLHGADGPVEPSAQMRKFAAHLRGMHAALVAEGFTEQQSLAIVSNVLAAGVSAAIEQQQGRPPRGGGGQ